MQFYIFFSSLLIYINAIFLLMFSEGPSNKKTFRSVVDYMMFYSPSEYFFTKAKLKHMSLKKIIKPNFGS